MLASIQGIELPNELPMTATARRISGNVDPEVRELDPEELSTHFETLTMSKIEPGSHVCLLYDSTRVGTAKVAETNGLFRVNLHGTNLEELQKNGQKLVTITSCQFAEEYHYRSFPYVVPGPDEPPSTLQDVHCHGYYPWDFNAMSMLYHLHLSQSLTGSRLFTMRDSSIK